MPTGFVTVRDGDFYLDGKKWFPLGINYWPSNIMTRRVNWRVCGNVPWLDPIIYHGNVVEEDMKLLASLGINMLVIQLVSSVVEPEMWQVTTHKRYQHVREQLDPDRAANLNNFLERAGKYDMKVMVFLLGSFPLYYNRNLVENLITSPHLHTNPFVFAYDISWEAHLGFYVDRVDWDEDWEQWVVDRYGGVGQAEKTWGVTAPTRDGTLTGPSDDELGTDGPSAKFEGDYRRFAAHLVERKYEKAVSHIKSIAPRQLVSARSNVSIPNGTAHHYPLDLAPLGRHLDFLATETWMAPNLLLDWRSCRRLGFTNLYARYVSDSKPVVILEAGYGNSAPDCPRTDVEEQKTAYRNILRMARESGANGIAFWWFPPGRRLDEKNYDFSILETDGTRRPCCEDIRKAADEIRDGKWERRPADEFLKVAKADVAAGFYRIFNDNIDTYIAMLDRGKTPGIIFY